jgi:hypothetical protein
VTNQQLLGTLKNADLGRLPNIHQLSESRLVVLWILAAVKGSEVSLGLSSAQISDLLRDGCGIAMSRQRVKAIVENENGTVAKLRQGSNSYYKIMRSGEELIAGSAHDPVLIQPDKALSGIRKVEELLGFISGDVRVCDPYVDNRTLDYLSNCAQASSIRLLTQNIYRDALFKRDLKAFNQENGDSLEVRVAAGRELHDRYVIHGNGMMLIGTSLNNIGAKQSFIVALGEDIRSAATSWFDKTWNTAARFP